LGLNSLHVLYLAMPFGLTHKWRYANTGLAQKGSLIIHYHS